MLQMTYDGSLSDFHSGFGAITTSIAVPASVREAAERQGLSASLNTQIRAVIAKAAEANQLEGSSAFGRLSSRQTYKDKLLLIDGMIAELNRNSRAVAAGASVEVMIQNSFVPAVIATLMRIVEALVAWISSVQAAIRRASMQQSNRVVAPAPTLPAPGQEEAAAPPPPPEEGMGTMAKVGIALALGLMAGGAYYLLAAKDEEEEEGAGMEPAMAGFGTVKMARTMMVKGGPSPYSHPHEIPMAWATTKAGTLYKGCKASKGGYAPTARCTDAAYQKIRRNKRLR